MHVRAHDGSGERVVGYKMVRDLHKKKLESVISGSWRTAPDPVSSLIKKLGEEYSELCEDRDPGELYDIMDVVQELIVLLDGGGACRKAHVQKVLRLGLFGDHLEWHPNPEITWNQLEARG